MKLDKFSRLSVLRSILIACALSAITLAIGSVQGCGGGAALIGGGVITGGRALAGGLVGDLSRALNVAAPGIGGRGLGANPFLPRTRQGTCPEVSFSPAWDPNSGAPPPNPLTITVDYGTDGTGCYYADLGATVSGSITFVLSGAEVDPDTGRWRSGTLRVSFNNLTVGAESLNGSWTWTVENESRWTCVMNLTFTSGSVRQILTFGTETSPGTFTFTGQDVALSGSGTYNDSAHPEFGTVSFTFDGLTYDFGSPCPYPVSGGLRIHSERHRIQLSFNRSLSCGHANLIIDGVSQGVVDLTRL